MRIAMVAGLVLAGLLGGCQTTSGTAGNPPAAAAPPIAEAPSAPAPETGEGTVTLVGGAPEPAFARTIAPPPPELLSASPERHRRAGCYTVDLFEDIRIDTPAAGVPLSHARFLGFWGDGAWDGDWCNELVVTAVHADGRVDLLDLHAPSERHGARATAFQREGRITPGGVLRVDHGGVERRYALVDGRLHGMRRGPRGEFLTVLERQTNPQVAILEAAAAMIARAEDLREAAARQRARRETAAATPAEDADAAATPIPAATAPAAAGAVIASGRRIALVIGNAAYAHVPPLANPSHDAGDIGAALSAAGFAVTRLDDAGFAGLRRTLSAFRRAAARAEVAVVYYAGHGIELDRRNYMIPVDARLAEAGDADFEAMPLELIEQAAAPASRLSLVVVDACRNNPFAERLPRRARSLAGGLARVEPVGRNRLVAFAAKEGTVASDGEGRNSPYAAALVEALATPGLEIGKLFRRVRDRVVTATGGAQEPALYGSLSEADFYFLPPVEVASES